MGKKKYVPAKPIAELAAFNVVIDGQLVNLLGKQIKTRTQATSRKPSQEVTIKAATQTVLKKLYNEREDIRDKWVTEVEDGNPPVIEETGEEE